MKQTKTSRLTHPLAVTLLASLCCLLWGSAIPFINLGYRLFDILDAPAPTLILFAGCRFFLAGVLTTAFASIKARRIAVPKRESRVNVLKLALVQTVMQYVFFYIGVANTTSVKGSIIQGLNAFVAILVSCYLFRSERMNRLKWMGGLLGVAGIVLVNVDGSGLDPNLSLMGEGFLIISMTASACSAGMIKRFGQTDDPVIMSGWQFIVGGLGMIAGGLLCGGHLTVVSPAALGVLLYLALLSATAYSLWAVLLRVNPVSRVAVYTFLQPIFGVLLSLLLVDSSAEMPLLRYGAALVLICLSIYIVGRGQQYELVRQEKMPRAAD